MKRKLKFSLEGIMFQPNSKFAQELIASIRELKEYPQTLPKRGITEFKKVYFETMDFFEKTTAKKLSDTIFKYTGIKTDKIYCRELFGNVPYAAGVFFMNISYPTDSKKITQTKWFGSVKDVISGGATKEYLVSPETSAEFDKLINNFDDVIGRFKPAESLDGLINMRLGFDLGAVCFSDKIIHEKVIPLTAEETAATLLHEIGHVLSAVSYLKYCHYSYDVVTNAFDHFNKYASVDEKIKFIKTSKLINSPSMETAVNNNPLLKQVKKLSDKIEIESNTVQVGMTTSVVICNLVSFLFCTIFNLIFSPVYLLLKYLNYSIEASPYEKSDSLNKISDFKLFNVQCYEEERLADEYVTKHNMGSYLQSSFLKINNLYAYVSGSDGNAGFGYANKGTGIFHLTNFMAGLDLILVGGLSKSLSSHPETKERFHQIAASQIKNIKSVMNSPALLKLALEEYERCHKNIFANNTMKNYELAIAKLSEKIDNIVSIVTFGLISMEQQNQLNSLMSAALQLMDNDMFASMAKLKMMLKNK